MEPIKINMDDIENAGFIRFDIIPSHSSRVHFPPNHRFIRKVKPGDDALSRFIQEYYPEMIE